MAAAFLEDETEDMVTCSVCLYEYDEKLRLPKYLPKCHHTVCVSCLKEIVKDMSVACPLCRNVSQLSTDVDHLPNNAYPIHMLKQYYLSVDETAKKLDSPKWCLSCGTKAKLGCISGKKQHSWIEMEGASLNNIQDLLALDNELKKQKDSTLSKLEVAIRTREEARDQMNKILNAFETWGMTFFQLQAENNQKLSELKALLLDNDRSAMEGDSSQQLPNLNDLLALMDEDSTIETLREKMTEKLLFPIQEKVDSEANEAIEMQNEVAANILSVQSDLTHRSPQSSPASSPQDENSVLNYSDVEILETSIASLVKRPSIKLPPKIFNPHQSKFILRIAGRDFTFQLLIVPLPPSGHDSSRNIFTKAVGGYCFNLPGAVPSKKITSKKLEQASVKDVFVQTTFTIPSSLTRKMNLSLEPEGTFTGKVGEVGVILVTDKKVRNKVIDWDFVFPLDKFRKASNARKVADLPIDFLFGSYEVNASTTRCMSKLSGLKGKDYENVVFTLHSM